MMFEEEPGPSYAKRRRTQCPAVFLCIVVAMLISLLAGCGAGQSSLVINPDRDVSGFKRVPLTPKSMHLLQRVAIGRTIQTVPIDVAEAERRIMEGTRVCWSMEKLAEDYSGGTLGSALKPTLLRAAVLEDWPEEPAKAIGLARYVKGAITDRQGGFIVMFVIAAAGEHSTIVRSYQREATNEQSDLIASADDWLAGRTSGCKNRVGYFRPY